MSVDRDQLLAAFRAAVASCDPARLVREGLRADEVVALVKERRRFGVAVGKAALAMARGAGSVERGVIVVPARRDEAVRDEAVRDEAVRDEAVRDSRGMFDFADIPTGWRVVESAHPFVDERSVIAAKVAREVIDAASEGDVVIALVSGGTSALIEEPIDGVAIEELGAITRAVMEAGASIGELNDVRSTLSRVKRGGLVASCAAPVVTLAISDVIGDGLATIGSGPTIGAWFVDDEDARRERARRVVERSALFGRERAEAIADAIEHASSRERENARAPISQPEGPTETRARDIALVVGRMADFGQAALGALGPHAWLEYVAEPLQGDVSLCAKRLVELVGVVGHIGGVERVGVGLVADGVGGLVGDVDHVTTSDATVHGTYVAWGEPTLRVPADHGEGGRAQQLALELAKALRGTNLIAMAIGSDGVDGPPPAGRAAPAGALVDGTTWDAIVAAGHDPERALARCDAGTVLDAVGALVVTGPTGINHGDLVVIGDRTRAPR